MNDITSFVERLYENVLGRNSDINGLNNWINTLQLSNAADVAKSFFNSQEFLNANYSNGEYIEKLYQTFMDRNSDIGGYNNWLNQLQFGVSRNSILDSFAQSQEFSTIAQNYGINAYDSNLTEIEYFVNRFYTEVLERSSDVSGLENWSSHLKNGTKTADDIAKGFFFSQEFLNKNLNNSDFVDIVYQSLLGRNPDSVGRSHWINNLDNGMSRSDMLDGFIYSDEFKDLANNYGIEVGVKDNEVINPSAKYYVGEFITSNNDKTLLNEVFHDRNDKFYFTIDNNLIYGKGYEEKDYVGIENFYEKSYSLQGNILDNKLNITANNTISMYIDNTNESTLYGTWKDTYKSGTLKATLVNDILDIQDLSGIYNLNSLSFIYENGITENFDNSDIDYVRLNISTNNTIQLDGSFYNGAYTNSFGGEILYLDNNYMFTKDVGLWEIEFDGTHLEVLTEVIGNSAEHQFYTIA